MAHRIGAPPGAHHRLTDAEREELSRRVREANKRSEQGAGR
ncbi:hypothetical protein ACPCAE_33645 [Streptomyces cinereoruber]